MKKLAFFAIVSSFLYAAGDVSHHTDIIPRSINFLIFVAILWYLVGGKAVEFFRNRKEGIAKKFQEVEKKLNEAKVKKEELELKVAEARALAKKMIEDAQNESNVIYNNIMENTKLELEGMEKMFETFKESELRKAKKEVVKEFMDNILKDIHISSEDAAKLILKAA